MENILARLQSRLEPLLWKVKGYPVVRNVNRADERMLVKRALLVYLVKPFLVKGDNPVFFWHQNMRQCKQMAAILGEFGYVVDAVNFRDGRFRPKKKYDLIISHCLKLPYDEKFLNPTVKKIYLATGMNHQLHNHNVKRRYQNLFKRKEKCIWIIRWRSGHFPELVSESEQLPAHCTFPGTKYAGHSGTMLHPRKKV